MERYSLLSTVLLYIDFFPRNSVLCIILSGSLMYFPMFNNFFDTIYFPRDSYIGNIDKVMETLRGLSVSEYPLPFVVFVLSSMTLQTKGYGYESFPVLSLSLSTKDPRDEELSYFTSFIFIKNASLAQF
ncbi:hypothetical protein RJT34_18903 [Clitoria ternatea]|uniref:Uncharacterized protein n=1 Tax=Clitoria ternatea TaxID=43366 RepID=A0AAN9P2W1_CLITE